MTSRTWTSCEEALHASRQKKCAPDDDACLASCGVYRRPTSETTTECLVSGSSQPYFVALEVNTGPQVVHGMPLSGHTSRVVTK